MPANRAALGRWIACAGLAAAWASGGPRAADLQRIERRVAAEPAYDTAEQSYCLLAFGPQADLLCWLVLDGEILHADRNCNGRLGEDGERFEKVQLPNGFQVFKVTDIRGPGAGPAAADELTVLASSTFTYLAVVREGKKRQTCDEDEAGCLRFAATAAEAPVIHFDGPLELRLWHGSERVLQRGARGTVLRFQAGTPGIGPGATAHLVHDAGNVPFGVQPLLEIEFPHRDPGADPIRSRQSVPDRCCHSLFLGNVTVPDEAAAGRARVTVSMRNFAASPIPPVTFEVEVAAADDAP